MPDLPHATAESLFSTVFKALPDAVCVLEPLEVAEGQESDWRYLSTNTAFCTLFKLGDLTGQSLRERFPKHANQWSEHFTRALTSCTSETLVEEGSDQPLVYEIALTPINHGQRGAIMVRIRDITSEHVARAGRREADARYKLLFDAIDEGFCIIELVFDAAGRATDYLFLEANNAFVGHTGLKDPVGKTMRIQQNPFIVIGVLGSKGQNLDGNDQDDTVLVPLRTLQRRGMGLAQALGQGVVLGVEFGLCASHVVGVLQALAPISSAASCSAAS